MFTAPLEDDLVPNAIHRNTQATLEQIRFAQTGDLTKLMQTTNYRRTAQEVAQRVRREFAPKPPESSAPKGFQMHPLAPAANDAGPLTSQGTR